MLRACMGKEVLEGEYGNIPLTLPHLDFRWMTPPGQLMCAHIMLKSLCALPLPKTAARLLLACAASVKLAPSARNSIPFVLRVKMSTTELPKKKEWMCIMHDQEDAIERRLKVRA